MVILPVVFGSRLEGHHKVSWIGCTKTANSFSSHTSELSSLSMLYNLCKFRVVVKLTNKGKRAPETKKRFMLLSHKHSSR